MQDMHNVRIFFFQLLRGLAFCHKYVSYTEIYQFTAYFICYRHVDRFCCCPGKEIANAHVLSAYIELSVDYSLKFPLVVMQGDGEAL